MVEAHGRVAVIEEFKDLMDGDPLPEDWRHDIKMMMRGCVTCKSVDDRRTRIRKMYRQRRK